MDDTTAPPAADPAPGPAVPDRCPACGTAVPPAYRAEFFSGATNCGQCGGYAAKSPPAR